MDEKTPIRPVEIIERRGLCIKCFAVGTVFDGQSPPRACPLCQGRGTLIVQVIKGSMADHWGRDY